MEYDRSRLVHIASFDGLREIHGKALYLAEEGYSHSGIAKQLDVTDSTARKYLDELQEVFGENVIESKPQHFDWSETWPDESGVTDY